MMKAKNFIALLTSHFSVLMVLFKNLSIVLFLTFLPEQVHAMNQINIDSNLQKKCEVAVSDFIQHTKQWASDEYQLKFHFVVVEKNIAVFSAIHLQALYENRQRSPEERSSQVWTHPLEISILVDIVDFSVQENTPEAVYRHKIPDSQ